MLGKGRFKIRRWGWLWTGLALAVLLAAVACRGGEEELIRDRRGDVVVTLSTPTPSSSPPAVEVMTSTPTSTPTPTPGPPVCGANPDPAPPSLLQVQAPLPQQKVKNPVEVRGWGSTIGQDDSGVAIAILKPNLEVFQSPVEVPPQPRVARVPPGGLQITPHTRPFAADLPFSGAVTGELPVCIWVYLDTAADGTPKGVVQVPVVLIP